MVAFVFQYFTNEIKCSIFLEFDRWHSWELLSAQIGSCCCLKQIPVPLLQVLLSLVRSLMSLARNCELDTK